jgi:hypothetical protein
MRKTIMLLLAFASPALPAAAQVTGREVFAAYCLGVFEQREQEGLAGGLEEDAARQQAETLGRLRQYLQIKVRSNPLSPHLAALPAAKDRGTVDQSECTAAIENISASQCVEECRTPIRDYDRCFSCIAADAQPETCKRVSQCKPAPLPQAAATAPPARVPSPEAAPPPTPDVPQPRQQSTPANPPANPPAQPQPQQRVAPVPALARPQVRTPAASPAASPPAALRQEDTRNVQARPAGQCAVSRPKPGLQVYLVTCPSSWAMIGRTVDKPTSWTISDGVNSTEAVDYFMKSRYAR